ncbi:hypothetical protein [Tistrella sp.]|uniref:hypothetical protein n=1 Tax=Tistrella sp. TaxID=2024861 RepID=UPI0025EB18AA|nr:hypothetical protein [Tistrella sp.]
MRSFLYLNPILNMAGSARKTGARPMAYQDVIDVIGNDAAAALCKARGGSRIYIPIRPTCRIVEIIGADAAARLCASELAGDYVCIPRRTQKMMADRAREIANMPGSVNAVARRVGLSNTHVARLRRMWRDRATA